MRISLCVLVMMGCGTEQPLAVDASVTASAVATCGVAPEQPEVPLIVSSVDRDGHELVTVDRAHWDLLMNYEVSVRAWSACVASH